MGTKPKGHSSSIVAVPAYVIQGVKILLLMNATLAIGLMIPHFALSDVMAAENWETKHGLAISVIIITIIVFCLNSFGLYWFQTLYIPPSVATRPSRLPNQSPPSDAKRNSDTEDIIGVDGYNNLRTMIIANRAEGRLSEEGIELSTITTALTGSGENRNSGSRERGNWTLSPIKKRGKKEKEVTIYHLIALHLTAKC